MPRKKTSTTTVQFRAGPRILSRIDRIRLAMKIATNTRSGAIRNALRLMDFLIQLEARGGKAAICEKDGRFTMMDIVPQRTVPEWMKDEVR